MRSATSYFNGTLYRKTMARFWPLWGMWGVFWLFLLPLHLLTWYFQVSSWRSADPQKELFQEALNLPNFLPAGILLAVGCAVLCAMAVFGFLYSHRSACWTHALPLRREALFTTQYLAGLSMMLLPLAAAALLTAIVEISLLPAANWGATLSALISWLLAQSGICLFFFSFAAFCAMFTGHILALPAFYAILNFLVYGLWFLVDALLHEFYYGYTGAAGVLTAVEYLTPVVALSQAADWWLADKGVPAHFLSPETIAVYALAGAALALVSLYVYRRRHIETAGDVVAVPLVRPLFKYGVAFCVGLAFGMFTSAFFNFYSMAAVIPCILVWAVIGYFAAEMLLKKSFRVFKAWPGAAATAAVMLVLCLACLLDVFGVVTRVPAAGQVEAVEVILDLGSPYDSGNQLSCRITDPDQVEKVIALHQAIVDNRDRPDDARHSDYTSAVFTYRLANGKELRRRYHSVPILQEDRDTPGAVFHALDQIAGDRDLVAQAYGFDSFLEGGRLTGAWLNHLLDIRGESQDYFYVDDYAQQLWEAMLADFNAGNIGIRYPFTYSQERYDNTYRTDLCFNVSVTRDLSSTGSMEITPGGYTRDMVLTVTLTPQASRTLAVLDQAGVWEQGYSLARWNEEDPASVPTDMEIVYP